MRQVNWRLSVVSWLFFLLLLLFFSFKVVIVVELSFQLISRRNLRLIKWSRCLLRLNERNWNTRRVSRLGNFRRLLLFGSLIRYLKLSTGRLHPWSVFWQCILSYFLNLFSLLGRSTFRLPLGALRSFLNFLLDCTINLQVLNAKITLMP